MPPSGSVYRASSGRWSASGPRKEARPGRPSRMMPGGCIGRGTSGSAPDRSSGRCPGPPALVGDGLVNLVDVGESPGAHVAQDPRHLRSLLPARARRAGGLAAASPRRPPEEKAPTRELTADEARAQALGRRARGAPQRRRVRYARARGPWRPAAACLRRACARPARATRRARRVPRPGPTPGFFATGTSEGSGPATTTTTTEQRTDDPHRLIPATRAKSRSSCWPRSARPTCAPSTEVTACARPGEWTRSRAGADLLRGESLRSTSTSRRRW